MLGGAKMRRFFLPALTPSAAPLKGKMKNGPAYFMDHVRCRCRGCGFGSLVDLFVV
jgi:hypothetical protein